MSWKRNPKDSLDGVRISWRLHELLADDNRRAGDKKRERFHRERIDQLRYGMEAIAGMYERAARMLP